MLSSNTSSSFPISSHLHASTFSTRALQERSTNLQTESSVSVRAGPLLKYDVPSPSYDGAECHLTNAAGDHVVKHPHFYQLTPVQLENFRWLEERAWSTGGYKKYREGTEEKRKTKKEEAKWPDDREDLFLKAIIKFPPVGRAKSEYPPFEKPNKILGRNEHIANYLNDILGLRDSEEVRNLPDNEKAKVVTIEIGRKQVSSHLQVLKKYFEHDPEVTRWLGEKKEKDKDKEGTQRSSGTSDRCFRPRRHPYQPVNRPNNRSSSRLPPPAAVLHSQELEPREFCMYLEEEDIKDRMSQVLPPRIHAITQRMSAIMAPDVCLATRSHWKSMFPFLEDILGQVDNDCSIFYADASLNMPEAAVMPNMKLNINHAYTNKGIIRDQRPVFVRTVFCEGETQLEPQVQRCDIRVDELGERGTNELCVPFASAHWVRKLGEINTALKALSQGVADGLDNSGYHRNQRLKQIKDHVKSITAIQTVYYVSPENLDGRHEKTVLVLCWKFRLTGPNEAGTTVFRKLVPPAIRTVMPDFWLKSEPSFGQREESSFAINEDRPSYDSPHELPLTLNVQPLDNPSYSFHGAADGHDSSYAATSFDHPYDPRLYNTSLTAGLPTPNVSDDGSDLGDLTQVTDTDLHMFEYAGLSTGNENLHHASLMGPGDGLALLHNQLQIFEPGLLNVTEPSPVSSSSFEDAMAHAVQHSHNGGEHLAGSAQGFAAHGFNPYLAHHKLLGHVAGGGQDDTFHHYHRREHLQRGHYSHIDTPEVSTPTHEDQAFESTLILATPWYPPVAEHQQDLHNHSHHHGLIHHQQSLQLFHSASELALEARDASLAHTPSPPELTRQDTHSTDEIFVKAEDEHDITTHLPNLEHMKHDLQVHALPAGFDDADWDMLPNVNGHVVPVPSSVDQSFEAVEMDEIRIDNLTPLVVEAS